MLRLPVFSSKKPFVTFVKLTQQLKLYWPGPFVPKEPLESSIQLTQLAFTYPVPKLIDPTLLVMEVDAEIVKLLSPLALVEAAPVIFSSRTVQASNFDRVTTVVIMLNTNARKSKPRMVRFEAVVIFLTHLEV